MKLALFSLLILGAMLVGSEAYCPCKRTCLVRKIYIRPPCCSYRVYSYWVTACFYHGNCYGKRSSEPEMNIGFPCDFTKYDTDKDGKISEEQLMAVLHVNKSQAGDLDTAFDDADEDDDGSIDCEEFKKAHRMDARKNKG